MIAAPAPLNLPAAPSNVTSITKDAGATVSWLHPGTGVTSYTITPYISGTPQSGTTIASGSVGTLTGSNGNTYKQGTVTGLTNSTAYTFTVKANGSSGSSPESPQSGANTPLAGLVFGDDFNGSAGGDIDPEWYIYNRCGFIAQSEIEWYLPSQVALDGSSNLLLKATKTAHSGPSYPSDGNTVRNQSWLSGACQSNARTFAPTGSNTMTFEAKQQICPDIAGGMWPGLFWLEGSHYLNLWKSDPAQPGWDDTTQAEIDVAEFNPTQVFDTKHWLNNTACGGGFNTSSNSTASDLSAALHVYTVKWKPSASCIFFLDGSQTYSAPLSGGIGGVTGVPSTGASFFLLLYLQILAGSATADNTCKIDYVRVWDAP